MPNAEAFHEIRRTTGESTVGKALLSFNFSEEGIFMPNAETQVSRSAVPPTIAVSTRLRAA